ncbi:MAG: glycoside hydrolase family 38 C-terminal domain-containing protein [Eubacteriales bacterium]|nr:glycoside hydrolase family 38 C-terminal domain-containing protein [Eubacteriales bacterium]
MNITEKRIDRMLSIIKESIVTEKIRVENIYFQSCGYKDKTVIPISAEDFEPFAEGMKWGSTPDSHGRFILKGTLPEKHKSSMLRLRADTSADGWNVYNPQFICYMDGKAAQGFDTNHRTMEFPYRNEYEIYLYAYTGSTGSNLDFKAYFEVINKDAEKLYYDLAVPFETARFLGEDTKEYADITSRIISALNMLDLRDITSAEYRESVIKAGEYFTTEFYNKLCQIKKPFVVCTGHTHIDVAWLWTLDQTKEKAQHTFSTVLALMDKYPSLVFFSSQPQLFKYVKHEDPELFERIKQKVAEGRFELEGAMWVEADCNLTSGESLIRQIIHGKKFFKEEFGVDNHMLWLPDVFGYSASLPQICKKSGIDTFVTSKISWNDTNRMPHDVFNWIGIDGTELFTYFLTAQDKERGRDTVNYTTYVATSDPKCVAGCWDRFSDKALTDEVLLTMGWGDGGGGPTAKMCEKAVRLEKGVPGCPTVRQGKVSDFIGHIKKSAAERGKLPEWSGELYLEYHRGTYTSAAKNKQYNRYAEFANANAELFSVIAELLCGTEYPSEELYKNWETTLLNQFHDIIPGSSIPQVYKTSREQYKKLLESDRAIINKAKCDIARFVNPEEGNTDRYLVFNPTSFTGGGICVEKETGNYIRFDSLPSMGFASAAGFTNNSIIINGKTLENGFYKITFDENYSIVSLYDKKAKREVTNGVLNRLVAYEDLPFNYDCWNLEAYHEEKSYPVDSVETAEPIQRGCGAGYIINRRFMASEITQEIIVFDNSPRIDFNTTIDWKEKNLILKAEFDAEVNNTEGTFDIQYGFVNRPADRNTSWEEAKFEVCGQKYADISDGGYGIALINDCKYGHSVKRGRLSLSLLKASGYPNDFIDCDKHRFSYSLLPHEGDFRSAGVIREATLFNNPPIIEPVRAESSEIPFVFSLVSCDKENITVGAVKKSYDGQYTVFRFCESFNRKTNATFEFGSPLTLKKVMLCSITEEYEKELDVTDGKLTLDFKPFEIVTVAISFGI